jgi:hypothetical protein
MTCDRCGRAATEAIDDYVWFVFPATGEHACQGCVSMLELSTTTCRECGRLEREHPDRFAYAERRSNGTICADCLPAVKSRDRERLMKRAQREAERAKRERPAVDTFVDDVLGGRG